MRQTLPQRFALDKLGDEYMRRVGFENLVNRDDVRMVQRRRRPRFLFKAAQAVQVVGERHRQEFQRYPPAQSAILGQIDFSHAAAAEERDDLVSSESVARSQFSGLFDD